MANALLAYRNRVDGATLAGGTWASTLPLNNLKDRRLSKVCRSSSASASATQFVAALGKGYSVSVVSLCRHNFSANATWRLRGYLDAGLTNLAYDSGTLEVWPPLDSLQLEWQDDNFWNGKPDAEDLAGFYWNAIHILTSTTYARYWKVEIFDSANPAGYVEIGRMFLSEAWVPTLNMSYGAGLGYNSRTEVEEAWDGTEYFDYKAPFRVANFRLENMSTYEAMMRAFDMQRVAGIDKEVLFVWDQADVQHLIKRSFLGRLQELSPIDQPYFEAHQTSFIVKELL